VDWCGVIFRQEGRIQMFRHRLPLKCPITTNLLLPFTTYVSKEDTPCSFKFFFNVLLDKIYYCRYFLYLQGIYTAMTSTKSLLFPVLFAAVLVAVGAFSVSSTLRPIHTLIFRPDIRERERLDIHDGLTGFFSGR
jgi:hypothetical protein